MCIKKYIKIGIILFCFYTQNLFAGDQTRVQQLATQFHWSDWDQDIYKETIAACRGYVNMVALKGVLITTGQVFKTLLPFYTDESQEMMNLWVQNKGIGSYAADRINSEAFLQALADCYPHDTKKRDRFVMQLLGGDFIAKAGPAIGLVLTSSRSFSLFATQFPKTSTYLSYAATLVVTIQTIRVGWEFYAPLKEQIQNLNQAESALQKSHEQNQEVLYKIVSDQHQVVLSILVQEISRLENLAAADPNNVQVKTHLKKLKEQLRKMNNIS